MSTTYTNMLGWSPSDATHEGQTLTSWTSPSYDRQGGTIVTSVSRNRINPGTGLPESQVLATHTDSTSVGFGSVVLSVATVVDTTHGWAISLEMHRTDFGAFAVVDGSGAITWT